MINTLADRLLLTWYLDDLQQIDAPQVVQQVVDEMRQKWRLSILRILIQLVKCIQRQHEHPVCRLNCLKSG